MSFRDARHALIVIGMWSDPSSDEQNIGWAREVWNAMQPLSSGGSYVNYDSDAASQQVRVAYGPEKYERLVALKNKYDPGNLFRVNQNIKPSV